MKRGLGKILSMLVQSLRWVVDVYFQCQTYQFWVVCRHQTVAPIITCRPIPWTSTLWLVAHNLLQVKMWLRLYRLAQLNAWLSTTTGALMVTNFCVKPSQGAQNLTSYVPSWQSSMLSERPMVMAHAHTSTALAVMNDGPITVRVMSYLMQRHAKCILELSNSLFWLSLMLIMP